MQPAELKIKRNEKVKKNQLADQGPSPRGVTVDLFPDQIIDRAQRSIPLLLAGTRLALDAYPWRCSDKRDGHGLEKAAGWTPPHDARGDAKGNW